MLGPVDLGITSQKSAIDKLHPHVTVSRNTDTRHRPSWKEPKDNLRPGTIHHAHSFAVKEDCYGTRTFAAWNGGTPFRYNARMEAIWLGIALSWLMSVIPSKTVALG